MQPGVGPAKTWTPDKPETDFLQVDFCTGYKQWIATIYVDYPNVPLPAIGDHVIIPPLDEDVKGNLCVEIKRREILYQKENRRLAGVTCWCRIVPPSEQSKTPE